jgi:outer membrane protein assembly factor BamB
VRCFDGDAGCDVDGTVNNECQFDVDVCLLRSADPALPTCTPAEVTSTVVSNPAADPDLQALQAALNALLPVAADACTSGRTLRVPLRGPDSHGRFTRASKKVRLRARTASEEDSDSLKLTCVPRDWPSHGYDHANRRANPLETILGPANAANLAVKWQFDIAAVDGPSDAGVTSTPTVGGGLVFITAWNGKVYAVDADDGRLRWRYDIGPTSLGLQSSATITADGRLLFGDSDANMYCLVARTGKLLWKTSIGDPSVDHIWASPQVANGRVLIGIASHNDQPCTQGRLVALDVDTGSLLWTRTTVPDRICHDDTSITCSVDADCPSGQCIQARGAGVTATVAVDPTGEAVYMNTVGCYTFPSVGDEDSIFRLDAATGTPAWIVRVQPPEQFGKIFYHDFGFLNGPILADADDGMGGTRPLVVSGSKDGSLYARNPDGTEAWTRVVLPAPMAPGFAGFGLFNGAVGFAADRFYASLYEFIPPVMPAPKHLMAFSAVDGSTAWEDEIGTSWGSIALAGGLVFVGTNGAAEYYVYDAATGVRLKTITMPANVTSGASVVGGTVYVGYGPFGPAGGVLALAVP